MPRDRNPESRLVFPIKASQGFVKRRERSFMALHPLPTGQTKDRAHHSSEELPRQEQRKGTDAGRQESKRNVRRRMQSGRSTGLSYRESQSNKDDQADALRGFGNENGRRRH